MSAARAEADFPSLRACFVAARAPTTSCRVIQTRSAPSSLFSEARLGFTANADTQLYDSANLHRPDRTDESETVDFPEIPPEFIALIRFACETARCV